ncbi:T9SS type A sorting domain-containing protein [Kordia sp.]|uniref:T9SS type A sorting domain-containing protein n=1 Tax=Kordia sp. TaxID=1965332 RepID=UPI003D28BF0D
MQTVYNNFSAVTVRKLSVNDAGNLVITAFSGNVKLVFYYTTNGTLQWSYNGRFIANGNDLTLQGAILDNTDSIYMFGELNASSSSNLGYQILDASGNLLTFYNETRPAGRQPFVWKFDTNYNRLAYTFENDAIVIRDLKIYNNDIYIVGQALNYWMTNVYGLEVRHPDNLNFNSAYGFLMKMNSSLSGVWVRSIGSEEMDEGLTNIFIDANGIYISGFSGNHFAPTASGSAFYIRIRGQSFALGAFYKSTKTFLMKFDLSGTIQWGRLIYGNSRYTSAYASNIAVDQNNIYLSGSYNDTFEFNSTSGSDTRTTSGDLDGYFVHYLQDGTYENTYTFGNSTTDRMSSVLISGTNLYFTGDFSGTIDADVSSTTQNIVSSNRSSFITKNSLNTLDIEDVFLSEKSLSVVPNPTKNSFTIQTEIQINHVEVYDVNARKVMEYAHQKTIDISNLPSGMYYVTINTAQGNIHKKIIKI